MNLNEVNINSLISPVAQIFIAYFAYKVIPIIQRKNENRRVFYRIKSDLSLHMEQINELRSRANSQINHLKEAKDYLSIEEFKGAEEKKGAEGISNVFVLKGKAYKFYDVNRVFVKFLEIREKYFDERARLKDSYNDLIALLKEMDDERFFVNHKITFFHKREILFRNKVVSTYYSALNFLKELGFDDELYCKVVADLKLGMPHETEDLPKAIPVLGNDKKFYYGIWLNKELYRFVNESSFTYEKRNIVEREIAKN